jgi:hypothetical protein
MNKHITLRRAALPACGLLALGVTLARADIQTITHTIMPGAEAGDNPFNSIVTSSRPNARRVETTMSIAGSEQRTITLTLCDKKATYTLDPSLKIFYTTPLASKSTERPATSPVKRSTGKITMTLLSLREKGEQTIGTYKTRCYEMTMRTQTSGCMGASDTTIKQEICIAPGEAQSAADEFACGVGAEEGSSSDGCVPTVDRKGDKALWTLYEKVMSGLRVSTRLSVEDGEEGAASAGETRLVKISRDKLPDALFAIPQGFRQLTAQQFQAEQSKALMQKMMQEQGADENDNAQQDAETTTDEE